MLMDNFRTAQCRYDSRSQYGPIDKYERTAMEDRLEELMGKLEYEDLDDLDAARVEREVEQIEETLREEW